MVVVKWTIKHKDVSNEWSGVSLLNKSFILTLLNKMCGKLDGQQKWKDVCIKLLKPCKC